MTRLEANLKIISILEELSKKNPQIRFNQLLYSLNIVGDNLNFYKEPSEILDMIEKSDFYNDNKDLR
jgi:hypothetical protein